MLLHDLVGLVGGSYLHKSIKRLCNGNFLSGLPLKPNKPRKYLTPCSRDLAEELIVTHRIKNFSTFYGTSRFITAFTNALHLSLS
jgi:hypothetical protein